MNPYIKLLSDETGKVPGGSGSQNAGISLVTGLEFLSNRKRSYGNIPGVRATASDASV